MRRATFILLTLLFLLHHDFWYWDDASLVFGFLPIGLVYHGLYCLAAGLLWYVITKHNWPRDLEAFAQGNNGDEAGPE